MSTGSLFFNRMRDAAKTLAAVSAKMQALTERSVASADPADHVIGRPPSKELRELADDHTDALLALAAAAVDWVNEESAEPRCLACGGSYTCVACAERVS